MRELSESIVVFMIGTDYLSHCLFMIYIWCFRGKGSTFCMLMSFQWVWFFVYFGVLGGSGRFGGFCMVLGFPGAELYSTSHPVVCLSTYLYIELYRQSFNPNAARNPLLLLETLPMVLCSYPPRPPGSSQYRLQRSWMEFQTLGSKCRLLELLEKWAPHGLTPPRLHQDTSCLRSCRNLQAQSVSCAPHSSSRFQLSYWSNWSSEFAFFFYHINSHWPTS